MDELEQRLRSALTEMAEEVRPSHDAWEEQQRRLALKSRRNRRRPVVMAAVAAAVVALIAIPVVVINQQVNTPMDPAASLPLPENPPSMSTYPLPAEGRAELAVKYVPLDGETIVTEPVLAGTQYLSRDKKSIFTYAYTVKSRYGYWQLCKAQNVEGQAINGPEQSTFGPPTCQNLVPPQSEKQYFWGRRDMTTPGSQPGVWAYVMSYPADRLMLSLTGKDLVVAQSKALGKEFVLFVAYMNGQGAPKQWTVFDATEKVLQNG